MSRDACIVIPMSNAGTCKYQVGQAVEVNVPDFKTPGMPHIWMPATVESVNDFGDGLFNIATRRADVLDRNGDGLVQSQIVGPRGGNKRIRPAAR